MIDIIYGLGFLIIVIAIFISGTGIVFGIDTTKGFIGMIQNFLYGVGLTICGFYFWGDIMLISVIDFVVGGFNLIRFFSELSPSNLNFLKSKEEKTIDQMIGENFSDNEIENTEVGIERDLVEEKIDEPETGKSEMESEESVGLWTV